MAAGADRCRCCPALVDVRSWSGPARSSMVDTGQIQCDSVRVGLIRCDFAQINAQKPKTYGNGSRRDFNALPISTMANTHIRDVGMSAVCPERFLRCRHSLAYRHSVRSDPGQRATSPQSPRNRPKSPAPHGPVQAANDRQNDPRKRPRKIAPQNTPKNRPKNRCTKNTPKMAQNRHFSEYEF